jgi:hypothetical protein
LALIKRSGERINARTVAIAARVSSVAADDATLVAAAKSGDGEAFEFLVQRYRRMVPLTVLRITGNRFEHGSKIGASAQLAGGRKLARHGGNFDE